MSESERVGPPNDNLVEGGGATTQTHLQWLIKSNDSLKDDMKRIEGKLDAHAEIFRQQALSAGELQADIRHLLAEVSKQKDTISKLDGEFVRLKAFIAGCTAIVAIIVPALWFVWGDSLTRWFKSII